MRLAERRQKHVPTASILGPNPCFANILPASIAARLKSSTGSAIADELNAASIYPELLKADGNPARHTICSMPGDGEPAAANDEISS
jgi:hypothetical protein